MAIEFEVEDGTGKSNATSYMSVADFRQFWENKGKDYSDPAKTDDEVKIALNNATDFIGYTYRFEGIIYSETQALDFPREHIWDKNDIDVGGTVPQEVIEATAYLAQYEIEGKSLNTVATTGLKSRRVGPVSWTYDSVVAAGRPQIISAMNLLKIYEKGLRLKRVIK